MATEKIYFDDLTEYHKFLGLPKPENPLFSVVSMSSEATETTKCTELDLLAHGALEAINNAAFEALGDSLLELGDPVEIYHDVMPA